MTLTNLATCLLIVGMLVGGRSTQAADLVIVTEELPPYNYEDDGTVTGVSTEVVQAVLDELGMQTDIHMYPWARAYQTALKKPNVLIYSIARTPKREALFEWIGEVASQDTYLFKLASRHDIQLMTLDDAKQYHIGTWRDDVSEQYLLSKNFVKGKHLDDTGSPKQNILKLMKERIDLTSDAELSFYYKVKMLGHDPALFAKALELSDISQPLYMAFSRQTSAELVDAFRAALETVKRKGIYDTIHRKYLR